MFPTFCPRLAQRARLRRLLRRHAVGRTAEGIWLFRRKRGVQVWS